jgi:hypothetical protein
MNTTTTRVPSPTDTVVDVAPSQNMPAVQREATEQLPASTDSEPATAPTLSHSELSGHDKITAAIAGVMAEIEGVQKGGTNKFHDYRYARMQDILTALTPLLGKHGLAIFQTEHHRSMFDNGNVIAIQYRFTIAHASGQVWPEHPLQTGMSFCRDKHGKYDDKSLNKAHTAARKYFLLALFQIPTEDVDADDGPNQRNREAAPVPGPDGHTPPHRLEPGRGEKFPGWTTRYIATLGHAKSQAELTEWDEVNDDLLEQLNAGNPDLYAKVVAAAQKRIEELATATGTAKPASATKTTAAAPVAKVKRPNGCPNPEMEPDAFLAWADKRMAKIVDAAALAVVWEKEIEPASEGIMQPDYVELQGIHARHEKRLGGE